MEGERDERGWSEKGRDGERQKKGRGWRDRGRDGGRKEREERGWREIWMEAAVRQEGGGRGRAGGRREGKR